MDTLQILLLGPPDVLWNGTSLRIPRRSLRAMLFYLACNGQISRSELYNLFWPDETDRKAQANLRTALNRLRKALPDPGLVVVTSDHISLDRERVVVDVLQFRNLIEQTWQIAAQLPSLTLLPEWVVRLMRQSVQLWRSAHFMAGFSLQGGSPDFDYWLSIISQTLEGQYLRVLTRLADHFNLMGDLETALHYVLAGLEADPWANELHARGIRYMLGLNRISAASAYAGTLQARYAAEGEELSEELLEICRRAHQGGDSTTPPVEDWPAWLRTQAHLVNRRAEMEELRGVYRRGGTAVLWGEAGSGKTRLAYEFHRTLTPQPRLFLLSAFQIETSLPFQALIDALRRGVSREEWLRLPRPWLQQLSYLLPELAEPVPADNAFEQLSTKILRGNLYEALRQLLIEIGGSRKILMVLDQAQWADESTLAALAYLIDRGFFAEHGLLLLAARVEEPAPELDRFIQQSQARKPIQQIRLGPLSREDVAELAHMVLDRPLEESLTNRLTVETGGNPLFILETLRALIETTPAADLSTAFEKLPIGDSLYVLLQERLNRLQPASRQVATAAAVIGDEFSPEMIELVAQLEPEVVVQALDDLVQTHMIQVVPTGQHVAYAFIHRQIVEVIHWVLGPARLRLLHLRAARALEALQPDPVPMAASLAQHYEAAGEIRAAIQYWLKAAQHALSLISIYEAELAFQAADRLVQRSNEALPDYLLHELYTGWGELAYERADTIALEQIFTRLLQTGEERHNTLLLGGARRGLGDLYSLLNDPERAMDSFQQAEFYLKQVGDRIEWVRLYNRLGMFFISQVRYDEAVKILERAIALADEIGNEGVQEVRAGTEYILGIVYNITGWPDKAQQLVGGSVWRAQSPAVMYGHLVMTAAKLSTGERLAALEHARLGIQMAQVVSSSRMVLGFMVYQARSALAMGQVDDTWETVQLAMNYCQNGQNADLLAIFRSIAGNVYRLMGDLPGAVHFYRMALEDGKGKWDESAFQLYLGQALAESGQVVEGLRLVEHAYQRAREINLATTYIPAMGAWAYILSQDGQLDKSARVMQEWRQLIAERNIKAYVLAEAAVLCRIAFQRGDLDEARLQAERTILMGKTYGSPWWELTGYQLQRSMGPLDAQAVIQEDGILKRIVQNSRHPDLQVLVNGFTLKKRPQFFIY